LTGIIDSYKIITITSVPCQTLKRQHQYFKLIKNKYDVRLGRHEEQHTYQYQYYGPLFGLLYLLNGPGNGNNFFEKQADEYGATSNEPNWRK
jgi:hypothetical protein